MAPGSGVRKLDKQSPGGSKPRTGSQFVPKSMPKNGPSKPKPKPKSAGQQLREGNEVVRQTAKRLYNEFGDKVMGAREWIRKDLGLPKK